MLWGQKSWKHHRQLKSPLYCDSRENHVTREQVEGSESWIFMMRELSNSTMGRYAIAWIFVIVKICVEPPGATRNSLERSRSLTRFRRWSGWSRSAEMRYLKRQVVESPRSASNRIHTLWNRFCRTLKRERPSKTCPTTLKTVAWSMPVIVSSLSTVVWSRFPWPAEATWTTQQGSSGLKRWI
jgi:hypothetical protein